GHYLWFRVWHWLRRKHPKVTWKEIRRRYFRGGSWPASHNRVLLNPTTVGTSRYRRRSHPGPLAGRRITHHGASTWDLWRARCGESRPAGSGSGPRKRTGRKTGTAPRTDFTTITARTAAWGTPARPLPQSAPTD